MDTEGTTVEIVLINGHYRTVTKSMAVLGVDLSLSESLVARRVSLVSNRHKYIDVGECV